MVKYASVLAQAPQLVCVVFVVPFAALFGQVSLGKEILISVILFTWISKGWVVVYGTVETI